jgi:hypothetical protein
MIPPLVFFSAAEFFRKKKNSFTFIIPNHFAGSIFGAVPFSSFLLPRIAWEGLESAQAFIRSIQQTGFIKNGFNVTGERDG